MQVTAMRLEVPDEGGRGVSLYTLARRVQAKSPTAALACSLTPARTWLYRETARGRLLLGEISVGGAGGGGGREGRGGGRLIPNRGKKTNRFCRVTHNPIVRHLYPRRTLPDMRTLSVRTCAEARTEKGRANLTWYPIAGWPCSFRM